MAADAEPADHWKFQRRFQKIDTEAEPEHIQFYSFFFCHHQTEKPEHRELISGTTGSGINERAVDGIIFADGVGRQIHSQLRNLSADVRGESVAVGSGP